MEQWCLNHSANPEEQVRLDRMIEEHSQKNDAFNAKLQHFEIDEDSADLHTVIGVIEEILAECENASVSLIESKVKSV